MTRDPRGVKTNWGSSIPLITSIIGRTKKGKRSTTSKKGIMYPMSAQSMNFPGSCTGLQLKMAMAITKKLSS